MISYGASIEQQATSFGLNAAASPADVLLYWTTVDDYPRWLEAQDPVVRDWLHVTDFKPAPGAAKIFPHASISDQPKLWHGILVLDEDNPVRSFAQARDNLPARAFKLQAGLSGQTLAHPDLCALGWGLAGYQFTYFRNQAEDKPESKAKASLICPDKADKTEVENILSGIYWIRDLINFPASTLGPVALESAARTLHHHYGARMTVTKGPELEQEFPMIAAVGQAAGEEPRLIDMRWHPENSPAQAKLPQVVLVGKGVCFDTGGLNIKPGSNMRLMKKDMGGAAHVLGIAKMIMESNLPIDLRVLIPAVENSISARAYRPSDILTSRQGLSVEVTDTDAEGRLVLADALTLACEETPDILIDFATLTGAARVALGPSLPALFSTSDQLASDLMEVGNNISDPCWQLPLHKPYQRDLKSKAADLVNAPTSGYGGAITAALFLQHFVKPAIDWMHIDLMAWNLSARPGHPEGGEAQLAHSLYVFLKDRYSKTKA